MLGRLPGRGRPDHHHFSNERVRRRTQEQAGSAHRTRDGRGPAELMRDWRSVARRALAAPGTVGAAPFVDVQAMVGRSGYLQPAVLHGVDPAVSPASRPSRAPARGPPRGPRARVAGARSSGGRSRGNWRTGWRRDHGNGARARSHQRRGRPALQMFTVVGCSRWACRIMTRRLQSCRWTTPRNWPGRACTRRPQAQVRRCHGGAGPRRRSRCRAG